MLWPHFVVLPPSGQKMNYCNFKSLVDVSVGSFVLFDVWSCKAKKKCFGWVTDHQPTYTGMTFSRVHTSAEVPESPEIHSSIICYQTRYLRITLNNIWKPPAGPDLVLLLYLPSVGLQLALLWPRTQASVTSTRVLATRSGPAVDHNPWV